MTLSANKAGIIRGSQALMHSLNSYRKWCRCCAALLLLAFGSLSAASTHTGFPVKPADTDQATWTTLQNAVAETVPESIELTANDGALSDQFGISVALSGTTALVGAESKTVGSNFAQGVVYVFTFNGSTWVQRQELTASDGAGGDGFGSSVALSDTTALVGAAGKTIGSNSGQGAAYVFTYNGSAWVQQQQLTASDGAAGDDFGNLVALSATTALVGAAEKTIGLNYAQGAAYVFTFNGSTWNQQKELTASDGHVYDQFGWSVALSGTTALIGAYFKTIGSNTQQGSAYVFTFNGSTWSQQQELTANDGAAYDYFGSSVALSGTTALVGAFEKTIGSNTAQGAAYVFVDSGGHWTQQQELTASDGATYDEFGNSVALSDTTALVGADEKTIGSNAIQGAAYVFEHSGNTWIQLHELTARNGIPQDFFGSSVALSGTSALVGASGSTGLDNSPGAAYVFNPVSDAIFCNGFDGTGQCK